MKLNAIGLQPCTLLMAEADGRLPGRERRATPVSRPAALGLLTVVSLIMLASLAGCASPAPPATPTQAAAAPAAPAAPKAAPPTAAPAAAKAAATAPAPEPTKAPPAPSPVPTKPPPTATPSPAVTLQWFGHATFSLTTSAGTRLLMDPVNPGAGYTIQPIQGVDLVTVSHEHSDHNNVALAQGSPVVIRGLKGSDFAPVEQTAKGIKIRTVPTYHDEQKGAQRGKNAVFVFEVDGLSIVHLGDLGHTLSQEQVAAIGRTDVLMVPVGGVYTVDAALATQVVDQLLPRAVIPMHYKTPKTGAQLPIGPVDPFLEGKKVEKVGASKVQLSGDTLTGSKVVYLLTYE